MILENNELLEVKGGAKKIAYGIFVALGGLVALVVGIIDGYLRPLKCNS